MVTLTGKRFELTAPITGIEKLHGKEVAVTIPAHAVICVASEPITENRMVSVVWGERRVALFAVDIAGRATELKVQAAGGGGWLER